jgi:hypothetical protein
MYILTLFRGVNKPAASVAPMVAGDLLKNEYSNYTIYEYKTSSKATGYRFFKKNFTFKKFLYISQGNSKTRLGCDFGTECPAEPASGRC